MYADKVIYGYAISEYEEHIPENYRSQIEMGEIEALAIYRKTGEKKDFLGVTLTADHNGWLEIIWVSIVKELFQDVLAADVLRYRLEKARLSRKYVGAFAELHKEEETSVHADILLLAGFNLTETENNNYEFTLKDLTDVRLIEAAADKINCISVSQASEEQLYDIETVMERDERPIPAPDEIYWEEYEQDLSVISVEADKVTGLLLFKEEDDYLVLELAYSNSQTALPAMLGTAYRIATGKYKDNKKILVPIVGKGIKEIINKLVPGAKRGKIYEAECWFEKPDMPQVMEMIFSMIKA